MTREMKIAIVSGIISSVLVIVFIQPLLEFLWRVILSFGETIQAGYVDKIYKNAALGDRNLSANITLLIQEVFITLLAIFILLIGNKNESFINIAKKFRYIIAIPLLSLSITLLFAFSISTGIAEISSSFNQRLAVISPAITDLEFKQYKAMWANMRNQDDYRSIVKKMDTHAEELNIKLPELRNP